MVNCDKLLQHCPFEIQKVVKNTKNLILNMKIMLLSNSKNELCLIYEKYKKCTVFKYEECSKLANFRYEKHPFIFIFA